MTGADVRTGPAADKVRVSWHEWAEHARGCDRCVQVLASLLADPIQGRHSLYRRCCDEGAAKLGDWSVAVGAMVDHLGRAPAERRSMAGVQR